MAVGLTDRLSAMKRVAVMFTCG